MDFEDYAVKVGLKVNRYDYGEYQFHKTQVAYEAFEAGQQSKQAQINKALELLRKPMRGTVADLLNELEDILNDPRTNAKDCR